MNAIGTIIIATALGSLITGCGAPENTENEDVASQTQALWGGESSLGWLAPGSTVAFHIADGRSGVHGVKVYTKDASYCTLQIQVAWKYARDPSYGMPYINQTLCSYDGGSPFTSYDLKSGTPDVEYQVTVTNKAAAGTTVYYKANLPWW
jgi:hypothetical protein